jgi:hypothetical protein
MLKKFECVKITLQVPKENYTSAINALSSFGITHYFSQTIRTVALKEREPFLFFPAKMEQFENNSEVFKFFVPVELGKKTLTAFADKLNFGTSGQGSIYGEVLNVISSEGFDLLNSKNKIEQHVSENNYIIDSFWGISSILQRGEAESVIKTILDLGVAMPNVYFGEGTGFRDKIGLLRVTVPAEKEIVNVSVSETERDGTMMALIKEGKLDQPGRGFIYDYAIDMGIVNTKLVYAKRRHAASMEQLIGAVDKLNGNTEWRKHTSSISGNTETKMLNDLVCVTMYSNEGSGDELVAIAMNAGSSGATISKAKIKREAAVGNIIPAQELSTMIVGKQNLDAILNAVENDPAHKNSFKIIELKAVSQACTYLG